MASRTDPRADAGEDAALAALAEEAARAAGALLAEGLGRRRTAVETKSSATDMVTEMDRASEQLLVDHLLGARPDDGVFGEEGSDTVGTSGVRWLIDPLDGTTNYLYGHPGFAVSVAAQRAPGSVDGPPGPGGFTTVAGVVLDILRDEVFRAALGQGATCNGRPVQVSRQDELSQALIATGFGYDPDQRRRQAEVLARVIDQIRDVRRVGSAALDLCSVACGRVDGYYEMTLGPWDFAAGALIATEAGATVVDLEGRPPVAAPLMAAAPAIAEPLRALLRRSGAV